MRVYRVIVVGRQVLIWTALVGFLCLGCRPGGSQHAPNSSVEPSLTGLTNSVDVARVGTNLISAERFREMLRAKRIAPDESWARVGDEALGDLIRFESMYSQAIARGYDRDPKIRERIRKLIVAQYQEDLMPNEAAARVPGDAEIRAFYDSHPERFREPPAVRPAILLMRISTKATPEKRQELRRKLEGLLTSARQLGDPTKGFDHLARMHSEDPATRYSGGDCGWLSNLQAGGQWSEAMVRAVDGLKRPGDVSEVVEHPAGLCLIRLIDRRAAAPMPLGQVRDRIAWELRQESRSKAQAEFYRQQTNGLVIMVQTNLVRAVLESEKAAKEKTHLPPTFP